MEKGLIPGVEPPGFVERMSDFALSRQFRAMGGNLDKYGVTYWLSEKGPRGEGAWGGFVAITDELIDAKVTEDPKLPMAPTVRLTFDTQVGRKDFTELCHKLQAGITPSRQMPFCGYSRGWKPRLDIERFSYPELSTAGRVGTILLRKRYGDVAGGIDALSQTPVNQLNIPQGLSEVPDSLAERIRGQLGLVDGISPVSSGRLALIGKVMRDELEPRLPEGKKLPVQRPWGDRPYIEERAAFFPTKAPVPLSSSSVGRMVVDQLRERAHDIAEPYKKRNVAKVVEDFVDMATGLGLLQGFVVTGRALTTIAAAFGVAAWGTISDIIHRRQ